MQSHEELLQALIRNVGNPYKRLPCRLSCLFKPFSPVIQDLNKHRYCRIFLGIPKLKPFSLFKVCIFARCEFVKVQGL